MTNSDAASCGRLFGAFRCFWFFLVVLPLPLTRLTHQADFAISVAVTAGGILGRAKRASPVAECALALLGASVSIAAAWTLHGWAHFRTRLLIGSAGVTLALLALPACVSARNLRLPDESLSAATGSVSNRGPNSSPPQDATVNQAPGAPANTQGAGAGTKIADSSNQNKKKKDLPQAPQPSQSSSEAGPRQTNRMMWIVPNFGAVSPGVKFKPMTRKQKFWMATEDSFDYSSFVWTAVLAAQSYGLDQYPELGRGGKAYGRYYWRGLLDGVSNSYWSEAIVPVLAHQDARYFTLGHGGFFRRTGYALSRVVITYSDSGHNTFNTSEVGGDFASAALSTAYYPPQERGIVKNGEGWGTQLESAALNNIAKEFWPDIRKYIFHKH